MQGRVLSVLVFAASVYLAINPKPATAVSIGILAINPKPATAEYWTEVTYDSNDIMSSSTLKYVQTYFGSPQPVITETANWLQSPVNIYLGLGQPLTLAASTMGSKDVSIFGPQYDLTLGSDRVLEVKSVLASYDPRPYMSWYDQQFSSTYTLTDTVDPNKPWGSGALPGPSVALINVVSAGSSGYYKKNDSKTKFNEYSGPGGAITLNADVALTYSASNVSSKSGGLPWQPAAALIYVSSQAGKAISSGSDGGSVTLTVSNNLTLGGVWGDAPRSLTAAVSASSIGSAGGAYGLPSTQDNSFYASQLYDVVKLTSDLGGDDSDDGTCVYRDCDNYRFYSDYYDKEGKSAISEFQPNGAGGDVSVTGSAMAIEGYVYYGVGVSASSVGGGHVFTGDTATLGGDFYDRTLYQDSNTPKMYFPGSSGAVSVTLTNSSINLSGAALVGISANSTTSAAGLLPVNFAGYTTPQYQQQSGDVTVSIDSASSITLSQDDWAVKAYPDLIQFNAGVLAISSRSAVPIFSDSFYINDVGFQPSTAPGASGSVTVTNHGVVDVSATQAVGLLAMSTTGGGSVSAAGSTTGAGLSHTFSDGVGAVSVTNDNLLKVTGDHVVAIMAAANADGGLIHSLPSMSGSTIASSYVGGSNGSEEYTYYYYVDTTLTRNARVAFAIGAYDGQAKSAGGIVSVVNETNAKIISGNQDGTSNVAYGIVAQSIGSAGGMFMGGAVRHLGDASGGGGDGDKVSITNKGSIQVFGRSAVGILAQSIGGGGGAGANSDSWFVALGGRGGNGGDGGKISIDFQEGSKLVTIGDYAVGVIGHSIGGGGGHGGASKSTGIFVDTAIGGAGGGGGDGGNIEITSEGKTFWTAGQHAHGLVLQSIGGGGGVGGSANSHSYGLVFSAAVALGGSGGSGGSGGVIQGGTNGKTTPVQSHVVTNAHDSTAIVLQSVGAGGGLGGAATAKSVAIGLATFGSEFAEVPSIAVSFALGGSGGLGGHGGAINYLHVGGLSTYGDGSHGILMQSIGGGGGTGGDSTAASSTLGAADLQINLSMGLGGSAANGGHGGDVWLQLGQYDQSPPTAIRTVGHNSMGVIAQSIGGGGGSAGMGSGFNLSVQYTPKAEDDTSENDDTLGQASDDDDVANMNDFKDLPDPNNPDAAVNDASSTAGTADGDVANLDDLSDLDTSDVEVASAEKSLFADAVTCLKKMLATNSISAGFEDCDEQAPSAPNPTTVTLSIDVGKPGGGGGDGGVVNLASYSSIFTSGSGSTAMFAQSVGGGGGHAASAGADAHGGQVNATINVGGSGGKGGVGGAVAVINDGLIVTGQMYDLANPTEQDLTKFVSPAVTGGDSHGIHAQSIGGGGGVGGNADPHASAVSSVVADLINGKYETAGLKALGLTTSDINDIKAGVALLKWGLLGSAPENFSFSPTVNVGGTGGTGGNASTVEVTNNGLIRTFGHRSFGVLAQSIGGGGGVAGSVNGALINLAASETMAGISFNPSINVGGAGGVAGDGNDVSFFSNNNSLIVTHGYASYGIALQSVGGGGGVAHEGSTFGISDTVGLDNDVSVTGGVAFGGKRSSASYDANAQSANAAGSIGFGSGNVKKGKGKNSTVNYGNSGRSGSISIGSASMSAQGTVVTHGDDAMAIFAQTISGGGGLATLGCSNSIASDGAHYASACWGNPNVQGSMGQLGAFVGGGATAGVQINLNSKFVPGSWVSGGVTGEINVYSQQNITTYGARSMGLVTQNITGGGGFFSSANSRIHSVIMPTQQRVVNFPGVATQTDAGGYKATNIQLTSSTITTHGDGAWGLLSQAVVGGGGFFGDSSKDLAFKVKYDQNKTAASDVFAAGQRPSSITEVKFGREQVANAVWWIEYSKCIDTGVCNLQALYPGEPYQIPSQNGQVQWDTGDYLQLASSGDSKNPYLVNQYQANGTLKGSIGKGRIVTIKEGAFFFVGDDNETGTLYRGDGLITDGNMVLNGIYSPSKDQIDAVAETSFFKVAFDQVFPAGVVGVVNQDYLPTSNAVIAWQTAAINVQLTDSHIKTYGTNAHGMVLQNLGSVGGAWSSRGEKLTLGVSLVGANGYGNTPGGKVDLTLSNSSVAVYGPRSRGVVIQSDGGMPMAYGDQGQIKVTLSDSSSIYSAQHTALMLVGGSYSSKSTEQNTITVDNTSSITSGLYQQYQSAALDDTDAAYNRWAVYAPTGFTNLTNDGTITGNILLGIVTKGDFVNSGSWSGSHAVVATNSLHNYGTIYAGGEGATGGLFIDGSLKHYEGGEIHIDVHPLGVGESHDVITVTGLARIEGEIVPRTKSLMPGNYQFLSAGTLEHSGSVRDAHVFSWDATVEGNTLTKTPTANFAPAGFSMSSNQRSLANYLQRGWDSGEGAKGALFGYLHEHDDGAHGDYQATLNQLMGQTLNTQPIQFRTAFSTYLGDSLSCPTVTQQGLKLNENNCAWAKVTGDITEQSSNSSNPGYHETGGGIRLGAQRALGHGWSAGFGAGYGLNYLTSTNFSSNGQFFDLSVSAKKQIEKWEFGASLGFAQGWFNNNRYRDMAANGAADPMNGQFTSSARMTMTGLRLRAAYEHAIDENQYLKPYVDLDLVYGYMPGYSETGTDPLGLDVASNSRWNVAITPMLEYGIDLVTKDKSRVKIFASAGASFLPNNTHNSQMSFQGLTTDLGSFDVITKGPEVLGRLNLGIQAFHNESTEVRVQYGLLMSDGYISQNLSANLTWRF